MNDDNLTSLQDLTQENVLYTLKQRYSANKIYTYSGHTLVSINPYVYLPIYGKGAIQAYSNGFNTQNERFFDNNDNKNSQTEQENVTHSENHTKKAEASTQKDEAFFYPVSEAHIYSIAENALQSLCLFSSVTIIISGESGSGKTMNNNYVLEYFIKRTNDVEATNLNNNINFRINELLLAINPVLESFGNAKTILNENSSRFGKKLDLYLKNDKIVGAKILTYLLEKNRVTHTEKSEKNFHIFYYFCAYKNLNVESDYCNLKMLKTNTKRNMQK
ncbi:Myosin type-2 heavy chain 1 [Binucleata daphniae]